jgi:hypothetical protein
MPTEDEVKAYLSKRLGFQVTDIGYTPPPPANVVQSPNCCSFCGHPPTYHWFRPIRPTGGVAGHFCRDLAECEERERAKQEARVQEKKLWLDEIQLPAVPCGAVGFTPDAPPRG